MKRLLYDKLSQWKNSPKRLPLILRGARQVGKTYLLKAFGETEFEEMHYLDFERDREQLAQVFESSLSPQRLLNDLSFVVRTRIDPGKALLVFDEIQNCPRALTSLKYFAEELPNLAICAAGSLLGTSLSTESFPVGKVTFLDLYPMNFEEFLLNTADELEYQALQTVFEPNVASKIVHQKLWEHLKRYYVTGGMPSVVLTYLRSADTGIETFNEVRDVQRQLLDTYMRDFNKHAGKVNAAHIGMVFEDIPRQISSVLDGSIQRYRFKDVVPGKRRFADLQGPIHWLVKAGLTHIVYPCSKPELPLKAFTKSNMFSLRLLDVGLLGCILDLSPSTILLEDYGQTKGFFAENFVACEWLASGERDLYSWSHGESEIEFLRIIENHVIPVEVKSGLRTRVQSLRQYIQKYSPPFAVKITANPFNTGDSRILNIPLYAAGMNWHRAIKQITQLMD